MISEHLGASVSVVNYYLSLLHSPISSHEIGQSHLKSSKESFWITLGWDKASQYFWDSKRILRKWIILMKMYISSEIGEIVEMKSKFEEEDMSFIIILCNWSKYVV